ncbi:unnamed protein product [Lactuca saligna]|uniref:FAD/NAD(P)-binding domain-containing protein n=1 Tax=Lactuca saligna TaxID=75948 RepID=A0AA35Y1Z8_LACSI|nr:unnamed protein product [Lactuca saligna]
MSGHTVRECVYKFCKTICLVYGQQYLRKPTINDIHQLYTVHEGKHGFPGMLGSIDCMHWSWSLCPNAWSGQYMRGDHKEPTIILEAIASHDLWIWHAFFGPAGANNDINVLDQSSVFNDIYLGKSHDVHFQANRVAYKLGYYLTDSIYPPLSVFVKSFTCPNNQKMKKFKEAQELARKDVEQTFGVLKRRWQVLTVGARSYEVKRVNRREVHNHDIHHALRADLVEYIYRAHIQPPLEFHRGDLLDESDEDSDMFVESEDFDNESDARRMMKTIKTMTRTMRAMTNMMIPNSSRNNNNPLVLLMASPLVATGGAANKIVVIGGGVAGSYIAKSLQFHGNVTLIDPKEYFEIPWASLRGMVEPTFAERSLIQHKRYLTSSRLIVSNAIGISDSEILLSEGRPIPYNYLVIATGHDDQVPKTRSERLKQYQSENEKIKAAASILIVGGGPTGVELAGEIAVDFPEKKITLVHSGYRLLEFLGPKASKKTLDWLKSRHVEVKLDQTVNVEDCSNGTKLYTTSAGETIKADCHFLCTGKPLGSSWLKGTILKDRLDELGRLIVDENLRVRGRKNIFAIGDITNIKEMKQGYLAKKASISCC